MEKVYRFYDEKKNGVLKQFSTSNLVEFVENSQENGCRCLSCVSWGGGDQIKLVKLKGIQPLEYLNGFGKKEK